MNNVRKPSLIAFFSHAGMNYVSGKMVYLPIGNTERAAGMICHHTEGHLFRILRRTAYPAAYDDVVAEAKKELQSNARPPLENVLPGIDEYDVIYLGYPNWCGTMPMPVWTFLETYDFTGKHIRPFCTHEGSGWGRSLEDLKKLCPTAAIEPGLTLFGTTIQDADDDVRRWLDSLES